jgi:hypothetical protein
VYQEFTDFEAPPVANKDTIMHVKRKDGSFVTVKSSKPSADPFFYAELALCTCVFLLSLRLSRLTLP